MAILLFSPKRYGPLHGPYSFRSVKIIFIPWAKQYIYIYFFFPFLNYFYWLKVLNTKSLRIHGNPLSVTRWSSYGRKIENLPIIRWCSRCVRRLRWRRYGPTQLFLDWYWVKVPQYRVTLWPPSHAIYMINPINAWYDTAGIFFC